MKEASPNPQSISHGGTNRSSRRPDSNSANVNAGSIPSLNNIDLKAANHGFKPSAGARTGPGAGLSASQPAPAAGPEPSSSGRSFNTSQAAQEGAVVGSGAGGETQINEKKEKQPVMQRFWGVFKQVLFHSKLNVLLVFVPVGIAVAQIDGLSPGVIFAMNAVAIVPLAGLLSFATESVAARLGDSLGALLNVTFGNAVELIILSSPDVEMCRNLY
ncbi:hypothetical protein N0V88_006514 [Collariella sp. IMI 366227]|nr:hypothetical protein N0V88_006514 [Collariella sp. IMI 366227]